MKKSKASNLKIRCSSLHKILTSLNKSELPQGAKTYVEELWLQEEYGYRERVYTDAMKKGHLCEQESMKLVTKVVGGTFRVKNKTRFKNSFLTGEPDHVGPLEDYKNAQNLRTFMKAEAGKEYEYQIRGYMLLLNTNGIECNEGSVIYTINPDPQEVFEGQERKLKAMYNYNTDSQEYKEDLEQIIHNNELILNLKPEERVKVFKFERDLEIEEKIKERAQLCRDYYSTLKL